MERELDKGKSAAVNRFKHLTSEKKRLKAPALYDSIRLYLYLYDYVRVKSKFNIKLAREAFAVKKRLISRAFDCLHPSSRSSHKSLNEKGNTRIYTGMELYRVSSKGER